MHQKLVALLAIILLCAYPCVRAEMWGIRPPGDYLRVFERPRKVAAKSMAPKPATTSVATTTTTTIRNRRAGDR